MKRTIQVVIIMMLISCSINKQTGNNDTESDCQKAMSTFEKEFLSSCPISNGAEEVINYLGEFQGFNRNEKFDFGNGSVRFNAKDASIYGYPVLDEKSLFLLNYSPDLRGYESWILFQAIYFFERKEDKDAVLNKMEKAINEDLRLAKEVKLTLANEPYERFHLPCGSGFNLKHGEVDDKFVIDILWARETSK
ncbi:MAG: hypothetical protein R2830_10290 [Saprospiraceae bacterium]